MDSDGLHTCWKCKGMAGVFVRETGASVPQYQVRCLTCGLSGRSYISLRGAADDWNLVVKEGTE